MSLSLEFLDTPRGRLLLTGIGPGVQQACEVVVVVPALLEEMNLSRHFVAQQARRLAQQGWHTLILDPLGTGDSEGDLGQVSLAHWYADFDALACWLRGRGVSRIWWWAIRFGALLLPVLWQRWSLQCRGCLLWQPVLSGALYRKQLLRLRQAAGLEGVSGESLLQQAQAQGMLEVAGYPVSAALLQEMTALRFAVKEEPPLPLGWIEVTPPGGGLPVPVQRQWDALTQGACHQLEGPAFWNTLEVYRFEALLDATESVLATLSRAAVITPGEGVRL